MTGVEAGCVRGVKAAFAADDEAFEAAAWLDETVLAKELVEPMPFSKSPESRSASESDDDMLAEASPARTCEGGIRAEGYEADEAPASRDEHRRQSALYKVSSGAMGSRSRSSGQQGLKTRRKLRDVRFQVKSSALAR